MQTVLISFKPSFRLLLLNLNLNLMTRFGLPNQNGLLNLKPRFGLGKNFKISPGLAFSCLLHGQKLKLAEVYLNPNLARFD